MTSMAIVVRLHHRKKLIRTLLVPDSDQSGQLRSGQSMREHPTEHSNNCVWTFSAPEPVCEKNLSQHRL